MSGPAPVDGVGALRGEAGPDRVASASASASPSAASTSAAPRVWFVDVLRLIASFQMVNGHTLDAVMVDSIRQGAAYDRYLWFRGLVSVSFLFVAGIAFHLSTLCRFARHKADPAAVRRRFRRAGVIVLVGYLLAFPWGAFRDDPEVRRVAWYYFGLVDVLQCIGAALIVLELVTLVARRPRHVVAGAGCLALVVFAAAPAADALLAPGESHVVLNWFSHQGGSPFPLFPWAGFVFAGLVVGAWVMPQGGATPFRRSTGRLVIAAMAVAGLWMLAGRVPLDLHDAARHHASTEPAHSLEKLAAVLVFVVLLALVCRPLRRLPGLLRLFSSETLVIYAVHLILLFDPPFELGPRFARSLELPAALGLSAFMLVATLGLTWLWHQARRRPGWGLRGSDPSAR